VKNGNRIFLTGFMTSGKSTIGKILANVLGYDFFDMDREIENRTGKRITEIFEEEGEKYFRRLETAMLFELSRKENSVVALGGGTLTNEENLKLCKKSGIVIYLKVSPETLFQRLKRKTDRPLFRDLVLQGNSEEEILLKIKKMLNEREKFYKEADIIFETENKHVGKSVDELVTTIKRYKREKDKDKSEH